MLSLKKNNNEFYNQVSKQNRPKKSLIVPIEKEEEEVMNIKKGYYKFSDAVSGWNTRDIE